MNPTLHAILFILAVLIPGGLLIYFAWRTIEKKKEKNIAPEAAVAAFRDHYPIVEKAIK